MNAPLAVGQILVALVYAQFAGRIALSGSSYQWGSSRPCTERCSRTTSAARSLRRAMASSAAAEGSRSSR